MKKKLFLALIISIMLVCLFTIAVSASDFSTVTKSDTIDLTGMSTDADSRVVLANGDDTYTTYPSQYIVTSNASLTFDFSKIETAFEKTYTNQSIVRFEVPTTVTSVPDNKNVLRGLSALTHLYFKGTSVDLKGNSIRGCAALVEVELPQNTTFTNGYQFTDCPALTTVKCQDGLKSLTSSLFSNCPKLTSVELSDTITEYPERAFLDCKSLTQTIDLTNAKTIGTKAFQNCAATFVNANNLSSVGSDGFRACQGMTSVEFASDLSLIGSFAFQDSALSSVKFNGGNYTVDYQAFHGLSNLSCDIDLTGCTVVGQNAFKNTGITGVTFGKELTKIDGAAFFGSRVTYVIFNNEGTDITFGSDIFKNVDTLKTVKFKENSGITTLGVFMFWDCDNLEYLSIPDTVTTIKESAFYGCAKLGPLHLPKSLTTIDKVDNLFEDCNNMYFVDDFFVDPAKVEKPSVFYFPNLIESIPNGTEIFKNCRQLNETIVMGDKLTSVLDGFAFGKQDGNAPNSNIVFLGNVTDFVYYGDYFDNTKIYFCNPNTTVDTLKITPHDANKTKTDNCYVYICASNVWADLTTRSFENTMALKDHLVEKTVIAEPDCITEGTETTYCFCTTQIEQTPIEPTGHDSKLDGTPEVYAWYYVNNNFFGNATEQHKCLDCGAIYDGSTVANSSLFVAGGYSIPEQGTTDCISHTIMINKTNIDLYAQHTIDGAKINYGTVAAAGSALGTPIEVDDEGNVTPKLGALIADMTGTDYVKLVIKISGIPVDTNPSVNCNAYIVVGKEIYYVCDDEVTTVAKEQKLGKTA